MTVFKLRIVTENAAFQNAEIDDESNDARNEEVACILERIAKRLRDNWTGGKLMDRNGNAVGTCDFEEE